jgi:hypothetical protein
VQQTRHLILFSAWVYTRAAVSTAVFSRSKVELMWLQSPWLYSRTAAAIAAGWSTFDFFTGRGFHLHHRPVLALMRARVLARVLARARAQAQAQVQAPQAGAPEHPAQQPTQRVAT